MTLAPELPGAAVLIGELVARGIVVSAGHSSATAAQMEVAVASGVRMATHLFNAMPPFHPREPGIVGILGSTSRPPTFFGLIADGVHVRHTSRRSNPPGVPPSINLPGASLEACLLF